jgi:hypothetical protein
MSIRHYSGYVIECDGDDCQASFTGSGSSARRDVKSQARAAGWSLADDQYPWHEFASDLCPACKERAQGQTMNNPPQDEGDNP